MMRGLGVFAKGRQCLVSGVARSARPQLRQFATSGSSGFGGRAGGVPPAGHAQQPPQAQHAQTQQAPPSRKAGFPSPPPPPQQEQGAGGGASRGKVVAVGDANFDQEVVQSKLPVVCLVSSEAAARSVIPLILQAAAQYANDIKFAFLNSDAEMALAQELGVTKVPTMLPIFQGKLLEAPMVGAPTPQQAADFFRRVSEMGRTMGTMAQTAAAMNDLLVQGEQFLNEGALEKAAQCFEQAVQAGGPNAASFAGLALIALQAGEVETCESILKTVKDFKEHEKIPLCKRALNSFALSKALSSVIEELKGAQVVPGTPEATFRDAVQECQKGNAELAIEGLVLLIKQKSHPGAKDLLFKILNASPPDVANAGRKKLAQALFM